ncbi:MAG: hypothetical protein U1E38_09665 [Rhodospirillales bacterium]
MATFDTALRTAAVKAGVPLLAGLTRTGSACVMIDRWRLALIE